MTTKTTTLITTSELAQKMGKDRALRRTVGTRAVSLIHGAVNEVPDAL